MLKEQFILILFLFISVNLDAQKRFINQDVLPLSEDETYLLPALDNAALKAQYSTNQKSKNRFAEPRDVFVSPHSTGVWESTKSEVLIWRQAIKSPEAHSLNLGFTKFKLEGSAKLLIYNTEKSEVLGPFSKMDNDDHMQLWTPIVSGDEIIIELQVEAKDRQKIELELTKVNHDFKGFQKSLSQSCNLDVICGEADGWEIVDDYRDIIRSVGAYTLNGIDQCTGTLINNANNDCTPYFLTADHCNVTAATDQTVTVYWNFENSYCRQPLSSESGGLGDGLRNQFNTGAIFRAGFEKSDATLIELDDRVSTDYNPFFAGWSRSTEQASMGICIHHPGVEEKRISFEMDPVLFDESSLDVTRLIVDDWDIGSTEVGSSGSPLFNQNKQIIGQLEGGAAACSNNASDNYGWFRRSMEGDGTPEGSLRFWLDPDNTGVVSIDGKDCNLFVQADERNYKICAGAFASVIANIKPFGFGDNVSYTLEDDDNLNVLFEFESGPSSNSNRINITNILDPGIYVVQIKISDGTTSVIHDLNIEAFDYPQIPSLILPANGDQEVSIIPTLNFAASNFEELEIQIATDDNFSNIIYNQIILDQSFQALLEGGIEYFWRVRAINICEVSDWSPMFVFKTAAVFCTVIHSDEEPVDIGTNQGATASMSINFPYGVEVSQVSIENLVGEHTYISDLSASLSFNDKQSILFSRICKDEENYDFGFADNAASFNFPCPPINKNSFIPFTPLNVFNREFAGGVWTIDMVDEIQLDGGSLDAWSLEVCFTEAVIPVIIPENHLLNVCNGSPLVIPVFVYAEGVSDFDVSVKNVFVDIASEFNLDSNISNHGEIVINDFSSIAKGDFLIIELFNADNNEKLAQAVIQIQDFVDVPDAPQIDFPIANTVVDALSFAQINWTGDAALNTTIEIARDDQFQDVVFSVNVASTTTSDIDVSSFSQGEYFIRVAYVLPCGSVYSDVVRFDLLNPSSIDDNSLALGIKIYPNPSSNIFNIELPDVAFDNLTSQVFDLQGRNIATPVMRLSNGLYKLDLTEYQNGIYFLDIRLDGKLVQEKLVKISE